MNHVVAHAYAQARETDIRRHTLDALIVEEVTRRPLPQVIRSIVGTRLVNLGLYLLHSDQQPPHRHAA